MLNNINTIPLSFYLGRSSQFKSLINQNTLKLHLRRRYSGRDTWCLNCTLFLYFKDWIQLKVLAMNQQNSEVCRLNRHLKTEAFSKFKSRGFNKCIHKSMYNFTDWKFLWTEWTLKKKVMCNFWIARHSLRKYEKQIWSMLGPTTTGMAQWVLL